MTTKPDIIDQIDTAIELRGASLPLLSEIRTELARLRSENAEMREALGWVLSAGEHCNWFCEPEDFEGVDKIRAILTKTEGK